ncbi:M20 metallopeptidase family protein [Guptibacillus hwajinpoensis]|uniref:M20 metallopeptidase family protein n=1 Tax=Guptibacillus hwajinpoensis TaxID=208199 RepID=UPI0024B34B63|nr:amidohydrolase [Pseudalkalibacillus hwajinpoensis]
MAPKHTEMERAEAMKEELVRFRRTLHAHPELSFQEKQTAEFVATTLREIGVPHIHACGGHGVVGTISGGTGPTIAIRADIDALPIQESGTHSYRSKYDGVMHACGHDAHTAMLLGVAKLLVEDLRNGSLQGTVKLIFQPAEEATDESGLSGASYMILDGVLDDVEAAVALHVCPWQPVGVIQVNDGESMANVDIFEGVITGSGGHGGYPHMGSDPIWILSSVLPALYSIVNRRISPLETAVASIGEIHAGSASNVIPDEVRIVGTFRSYSAEVRENLTLELEKAFKIAEALGGTYEFHVENGEPALRNSPRVNRIIEKVATELDPEMEIARGPFGLGGEDFAYMAERVPAAMFFLGSAIRDGISRELHTPIFDIDERCLPIGTAILTKTAHEMLQSI